jgi:hypothetical protein
MPMVQVVWAFQMGKAGWSEDFWFGATDTVQGGDQAERLAAKRCLILGRGADPKNPPVQLKYQRVMDPANPSLTNFRQLDLPGTAGKPDGNYQPDMPWTAVNVRLDGAGGHRRILQLRGIPDIGTNELWSNRWDLTGGDQKAMLEFLTNYQAAGVNIRYKDRSVKATEITLFTVGTNGNVICSTAPVPHGLITKQPITFVRCKTDPALKGTRTIYVLDEFTFGVNRTNVGNIRQLGFCSFRPATFLFDPVLYFEIGAKAKHKAGRPLYSLVGRQSRR